MLSNHSQCWDLLSRPSTCWGLGHLLKWLATTEASYWTGKFRVTSLLIHQTSCLSAPVSCMEMSCMVISRPFISSFHMGWCCWIHLLVQPFTWNILVSKNYVVVPLIVTHSTWVVHWIKSFLQWLSDCIQTSYHTDTGGNSAATKYS